MRYLSQEIETTIGKERKMAFIAGPRQVGKTTFVQERLRQADSEQGYFNWDIPDDRSRILKNPAHFWEEALDQKPARIGLDEIHKYPRWKAFLKGFYDANRGKVEILITGSGRLDIYQKGGDSLFGRYHLYHLDPFSVGELTKQKHSPDAEGLWERLQNPEESKAREAFENLWQFGGFPEPLFAADIRRLEKWHQDHQQLILREDLRDLTQVREIGLIEAMIQLLPERIGSPLSINALREDLNVNFRTVQNWLGILERLYFLFSIRPFSGRLKNTLRREEKIYFYDWSELDDGGKRFENLLAVHLLKACHFWTDAGYGDFRLFYVRDKEKRETDFVVTNRMKPFLLVEAKLEATQADPSLHYFHERLQPRYSFQVVTKGEARKIGENILILPAPRFLAALP